MATACEPLNNNSRLLVEGYYECVCSSSYWTAHVDFKNSHSICYSLVGIYLIWSLSLLISLVNAFRLAYCLFWFIYQRRDHGWAIASVGAFQVLFGFFIAALGLVTTSLVKMSDIESIQMGSDPLLTSLFMLSASFSFVAFIRSHWSYIHITLASGLVAAAHRQNAVRTVRAVLILDVIVWGTFAPIMTPVALYVGRNSYLVGEALLLTANACFWLHAVVCVPLFLFYGSLVRTIDRGLAMKGGRDPAMVDLRSRLQSLRRRQFTTIAGALIYTIATHGNYKIVISTWAYSWPAAHLLITIGLTGYSFKYWSPSQENLGIARQVAMPIAVDSHGDPYLLTPRVPGGNGGAATPGGGDGIIIKSVTIQHLGDTNTGGLPTNGERGSIVASTTMTAAAAVVAATTPTLTGARGHHQSAAQLAIASDQQLVAQIDIAPAAMLARMPTSRNLMAHHTHSNSGGISGHNGIIHHARNRIHHRIVGVDVVTAAVPAPIPANATTTGSTAISPAPSPAPMTQFSTTDGGGNNSTGGMTSTPGAVSSSSTHHHPTVVAVQTARLHEHNSVSRGPSLHGNGQLTIQIQQPTAPITLASDLEDGVRSPTKASAAWQ